MKENTKTSASAEEQRAAPALTVEPVWKMTVEPLGKMALTREEIEAHKYRLNRGFKELEETWYGTLKRSGWLYRNVFSAEELDNLANRLRELDKELWDYIRIFDEEATRNRS